MRQQRNLLTVLGCSSSVAVMLSLGSSAGAVPTNYQESAVDLPPVIQSESNPIVDALGCGCATCQMSQIQAY